MFQYPINRGGVPCVSENCQSLMCRTAEPLVISNLPGTLKSWTSYFSPDKIIICERESLAKKFCPILLWLTVTEYFCDLGLPLQQHFPIFKCQDGNQSPADDGQCLRFLLEEEAAFQAQQVLKVERGFGDGSFAFVGRFLVELHGQRIGHWRESPHDTPPSLPLDRI